MCRRTACTPSIFDEADRDVVPRYFVTLSLTQDTSSLEAEIVIIGAGIVGLSCGAELAAKNNVILLEHQSKFGQDTSSRNSEVIHSGIYYPPDSLKTKLCIEGRDLLYAFCGQHDVPALACGKLLVATDVSEEAYLEKVARHCEGLDVPFEPLSRVEISKISPVLETTAALFFPKTGIVDSHQFMATLERLTSQRGGILAYRHRVTNIDRSMNRWILSVDTPDGDVQISTPIVINCAGLAAAEIANFVYQHEKFQHRFCRGRYFTLSGHHGMFPNLVYPAPPKDGLGIHVTISLDDTVRLGPDVDWTSEHQYFSTSALYEEEWSDELRNSFAAAARRYCPSIEDSELKPAFVGLRPKLFVGGQAHPDFVIENNEGFMSCLGIESPGLTSALAIAKHVASLIM